MGPRQGDGIGAPLALDGHGDLVIPNPIEFPIVMLGNRFHHVDGMQIIAQHKVFSK
jgi:hypothetical protein